MAWRRRRWDDGNIDVSDPFLCHQRPNVLSVQDIMVRLHMLNQSTIHA